MKTVNDIIQGKDFSKIIVSFNTGDVCMLSECDFEPEDHLSEVEDMGDYWVTEDYKTDRCLKRYKLKGHEIYFTI